MRFLLPLMLTLLLLAPAPASAEEWKITVSEKEPSFHGAVMKLAKAAGWRISWELLYSDYPGKNEAYPGSFPSAIIVAVAEQLEPFDAHTLVCPNKLLRITPRPVTSCDDPIPPVYEMTIRAKGVKEPFTIRWFRGEIEGEKPFSASNESIRLSIRQVHYE